jgi:hypothetical protein
MFARFKRAYTRAVAHNEEVFIFDGNDFVVNYAKYLIEYLGSHLSED